MKKKLYFIFIILLSTIALTSCESEITDKDVVVKKLNEASALYDEKYEDSDVVTYIDLTTSLDETGSSMVIKVKNDLSFYSMKTTEKEFGYFNLYNTIYSYQIDYTKTLPKVYTYNGDNIDMSELRESLNSSIEFDSTFLDSASLKNNVYSLVLKYNGSKFLDDEYYDLIESYINPNRLANLSVEMKMDVTFDNSGKVNVSITYDINYNTNDDSNISIYLDMVIVSKNFDVDYSFLTNSKKYDNSSVYVINNGEYVFGEKNPYFYYGVDCYAKVTFEKGYYIFTSSHFNTKLQFTISNNDYTVTPDFPTKFYATEFTENMFKIEHPGTYLVHVKKGLGTGFISSNGYQIVKLNYEDSYDVSKELTSEISGTIEGCYDANKYVYTSSTKQIKIIKNTGENPIRVGLNEYENMTSIYSLNPNQSMYFTINPGVNTVYIFGNSSASANEKYNFRASIIDIDTDKGRKNEVYITDKASDDNYFVGFGMSDIAFKIVCEEDGYYKFKSIPSKLTTYDYDYEVQYYTRDGKQEGRDYYYLTKGEHIIYATHNSHVPSYAKVYYEYSKEINPDYQYY